MTARVLGCSGSLDGGGSEKQLWQLVQHLDPDRFSAEVYLHYRQGTYLERLPEQTPVHAFWSDYQQPAFRFPGQIHRAQVRHLENVIRQRQIDLVYDRTFHMTLVTAPACARTSTPRVSVIVRTPSDDLYHSQERFRWWKRRMLRKAYLDPHAITIAVSQGVARDASEFYRIPLDKFIVLETPVDLTGIAKLSQQTCALPAVSRTDAAGDAARQPALRIAIVGRLSLEKGQRLAIEAAQRVAVNSDHRIHIDLLGEGPDREYLQRLAEKYQGHLGISLLGFQENPFPWIKAADVVCLASDYEGLPNAILEAMAAGTPVLATESNESMRRLFGANSERGTLVPVGDMQALANAIQDRMDNPTAWQQRVQPALDWVQLHHGLESWQNRVEQLFVEMLQRYSPGA